MAKSETMEDRKVRRIDSKFHVENDLVIKTSSGEVVPLEEPLFLIRARDWLALPLLQHYRNLSVSDGCNDWHLDKLDAAINEFDRFKMYHPERMKQPSITKGK